MIIFDVNKVSTIHSSLKFHKVSTFHLFPSLASCPMPLDRARPPRLLHCNSAWHMQRMRQISGDRRFDMTELAKKNGVSSWFCNHHYIFIHIHYIFHVDAIIPMNLPIMFWYPYNSVNRQRSQWDPLQAARASASLAEARQSKLLCTCNKCRQLVRYR